jgi:hypothetical protein
MRDASHCHGPLTRWRNKRERRARDRRALRSEFEIDRPRGFAALRALVADVGALERERIRSHAEAPRAARRAAGVTAARRRATSR